MAETSAVTKPPAQGAPKLTKVDLVNPTRRIRSIDLDEGNHTRLIMQPGEVARNVVLAEWVAKELEKRTKRNRLPTDLHVYPPGKAPAPASEQDEDLDDEDEDADEE